jgi:hypothetical protein
MLPWPWASTRARLTAPSDTVVRRGRLERTAHGQYAKGVK